MKKAFLTTNELLMIGVGISIIGITLLTYSISSYAELRQLRSKVDFEAIELDGQLSSSDKYYGYLEYSDFLYKKLQKNKNIPMKNTVCAYLDYEQHCTLKLYNLVKNKFSADTMKNSVVAGNIRNLSIIIDDYKNCSKSSTYKTQLDGLLEEIKNSDKQKIESEQRMAEFMRSTGHLIEPQKVEDVENAVNQDSLNTSNTTAGEQVQTQITQPVQTQSNGIQLTSPEANMLTPEQIESINARQASH